MRSVGERAPRELRDRLWAVSFLRLDWPSLISGHINVTRRRHFQSDIEELYDENSFIEKTHAAKVVHGGSIGGA
jgi:hypothetical protein